MNIFKFITALVIATTFSTTTNAGEVVGSGIHYDRVKPGTNDIYTFRFVVGELAQIHVNGDGSTDLDFELIDVDGVVVDRDFDGTDVYNALWVPTQSGRYTLRIINRDIYKSNPYKLLWN